MSKAKIILGIDPGLATTGYGLIQNQGQQISLLDYGTIATKAQQKFIQRLEQIHQELNKIIEKYKPEVVGCEELFFAKNVKTALNVSQARGAILLTVRQHKLPVLEFTPLQIKQTITNYGQANKKQMQKMVQLLLNLPALPQPDDAADALAIAITTSQFINSPLYDQK